MDDPDDSDFGAGNAVNQVVRISGKNQFARCATVSEFIQTRESG